MLNIVVYGTGSSSEIFLNMLRSNVNVICLLDSNKDKDGDKFHGYNIYHADVIKNLKYDYVVIASQFVDEIYNNLIILGVPISKILIFEEQRYFTKRVSENSTILSNIVEDRTQLTFIKDLVRLDRERLFNINGSLDYVRESTLELICSLIHDQKLHGQVAELGVYKGDFARLINSAFPNKKLYLFDTFESFKKEDIINDLKSGSVDKNYIIKLNDELKNTSEKVVMNQMPYPDKCIIKRGYFPQSLNNLDEKFCLVSLDVDLYSPILEGLRYFYPRLVERGYILIHDYNNDNFKGVRDAVEYYENELGQKLVKVPMSDTSGTLIISK